MFKRDPESGEVLTSPGSEFYDDSIPYEGDYISYTQQLIEVSIQSD